MVGKFSIFSVSRSGHRKTQSAIGDGVMLHPNSEVRAAASVAASAVPHSTKVAVEFKPVECPTEPLDNDTPVLCPPPEPSILNDGRIWKKRVSAAGVRRRSNMPFIKEGITADSEASTVTTPLHRLSNRSIIPSLSAPEQKIFNLLEESDASGI